jgi:hypothetical protein
MPSVAARAKSPAGIKGAVEFIDGKKPGLPVGK